MIALADATGPLGLVVPLRDVREAAGTGFADAFTNTRLSGCLAISMSIGNRVTKADRYPNFASGRPT